MNSVAVVVHLFGIERLIGKDGQGDERQAVKDCLLVAKQPAVSDKQSGLWVA